MATSVPEVCSLDDMKRRIANVLEKSAAVYRDTGDIVLFEEAVKVARHFYEAELKEAGNKGRIAWEHINKYDAIIGKLEAFIVRVKERRH